MSILTKNEYLLTKYFTELQINKSASEDLCKELVELLDIGTDISNGFLFNRLAMMLLGEYLTNDEIFFREYKKLRLEVYFLSEEHIKDMKQRLIALNHLHTGALKEEIIPNLKNFIEAIEKYDDIRDTTRKGIYVSTLSFLYRRNGLADDINFTYSLINKIDALDEVLTSDFSILDMVLGGTPYNFERV